MKYTFKGGTHPPDGKDFAKNSKIERMPLPKTVAVHLSQHIGAPSKAIVKKGDEVKTGQPLSEAQGFVSLPVHAPISGKIKQIVDLADANGIKSQAVIIESDEQDQLFEGVLEERSYQDFSKEELIKIIADAGIAGMGGARFPTHVKLSPPKDAPIKHVILNGVECEPYLTADDRLMQEGSSKIVKGLLLLLKITGAENGIIGIEKNKPEAIKVMKEATGAHQNIKVIPLEVKYPQGGEKQLIYAAIKKEVPSGMLPMHVGAMVSNVGTAAAVYEAVAFNKPFYERIVTVTGDAINEPKNVIARIGTPVRELLEYCGGLKENVKKVINGGPMMGVSMYDLNAPVHKGTSGILCLGDEVALTDGEEPCISCGKCVEVCPMNLLPTNMAAYINHGMIEEAAALGLNDCMNCGTCSYVCPANRHLVHSFILGKAKLRAMQTKK